MCFVWSAQLFSLRLCIRPQSDLHTEPAKKEFKRKLNFKFQMKKRMFRALK